MFLRYSGGSVMPKTVCLDFDGVLTDGMVRRFLTRHGKESPTS